MASFQIHEDVENIGSKIHTKKFLYDGEDKKIVKKTFGEHNDATVQAVNRNALKELETKIPKKCIAEKPQLKKPIINDGEDKSEPEKEKIKDVLIENKFLKIDAKKNVKDTSRISSKARKEYCPLSILHQQYGEGSQRQKKNNSDNIEIIFEETENKTTSTPDWKSGGSLKRPLSGILKENSNKEIYKYLRHLEVNGPRPKPNYMRKQLELNWNIRAILIDWLVSISDEYDLSHETLHISVHYIDRFLSSFSVVRRKFQLVGAAAMLLASKMEQYQVLDTKEWSCLIGDSFTPKQILKTERIILKVLGFNLKSPTICDFIQHLSAEYKMDEETIHFALYISELVLLEGDDYLTYFPSKVAAACVALARYNLSKKNPWPSKLKKASGYTLKELSPLVQRQHKTLEESPMKDQKAVATKYKSSKYNKVALLKPRALSLEYLEKCSTAES